MTKHNILFQINSRIYKIANQLKNSHLNDNDEIVIQKRKIIEKNSHLK